MVRFCGMMPMHEISKEEHFRDEFGLKITIQAGLNGWTIIFADQSTIYEDTENTVENNFNKALTTAENHSGKLTPIINESLEVEVSTVAYNIYDYFIVWSIDLKNHIENALSLFDNIVDAKTYMEDTTTSCIFFHTTKSLRTYFYTFVTG